MNWWLSDIMAGKTADQRINYHNAGPEIPNTRASKKALAIAAMKIHALIKKYLQHKHTRDQWKRIPEDNSCFPSGYHADSR